MTETGSPGLGRLLLASDGSPSAAGATQAIADIARRTGDTIEVAYGWEHHLLMPPGQAQEDRLPDEDAAQELVSSIARGLGENGLHVRGVHLLSGHPARAIAELADDLQVGLLVLGSGGPGFFHHILHGNVPDALARTTRRPMLVVPPEAWPPQSFQLVDGPTSQVLRDTAAGLATALGLEVVESRAEEISPDHDPRAVVALAQRPHGVDGNGHATRHLLDSPPCSLLVVHTD